VTIINVEKIRANQTHVHVLASERDADGERMCVRVGEGDRHITIWKTIALN